MSKAGFCQATLIAHFIEMFNVAYCSITSHLPFLGYNQPWPPQVSATCGSLVK